MLIKITNKSIDYFKIIGNSESKKEGDYGCHNSPPAVILEIIGTTMPRIAIGSNVVNRAKPGSCCVIQAPNETV